MSGLVNPQFSEHHFGNISLLFKVGLRNHIRRRGTNKQRKKTTGRQTAATATEQQRFSHGAQVA